MNIKLRNLGIRFAFCGALVISSLYMVWPDPITATAQIELKQDGHGQDGHGGDQIVKSLTQDAQSREQIPQDLAADSAALSADGADITRVSVSTSGQTPPRRVIN